MRFALLAVLATTLTGCLKQDVVGGASVAGEYHLLTVNSQPLPVVLDETGTTKLELLDHVIVVHQGGGLTYAESGHRRTTANGQVTVSEFSDAGSYNFFGTSLTFRSGVTGESKLGLFSGDRLTFIEDGVTMIFER
jgi:hypothetical protein